MQYSIETKRYYSRAPAGTYSNNSNNNNTMASPIMASDLTRSLRAFMRSEVKNLKIYLTIYARPCIILKLQNSLVRLTKLTEDCPAFPSAKLRKI